MVADRSWDGDGFCWPWLPGWNWFRQFRTARWWQPIIPLIFGAGLLWANVGKPLLRKRQIRARNPSSQRLQIVIQGDRIHIQAEGVGTFTRSWNELVGVHDANQGILMGFADGVVNWLPRRVFQDEQMKRRLHAFFVQRLAETANQSLNEEDGDPSE